MVEVKINQNQTAQRITIQVDPNDTLLESLERAGLAPEYQCRQGHCGACRCQLITGKVQQMTDPLAYLQPNDILPCISRIDNDIEIAGLAYTLNKVVAQD